MTPRPCSPAEAVQRALDWIDKPGVYWLGAGNYHPFFAGGKLVDAPWTSAPDGQPASDCRFAVLFCYKLFAHRPTFNAGPWATVADDINYNSAIEDAEHAQELFVPVSGPPMPGDIICYPTFRIAGEQYPHIGHGAIVLSVARAAAFDPTAPSYSMLDIAHCHGPPMRGPAITRSTGALFDLHSTNWPQPGRKSRLLRLVP